MHRLDLLVEAQPLLPSSVPLLRGRLLLLQPVLVPFVLRPAVVVVASAHPGPQLPDGLLVGHVHGQGSFSLPEPQLGHTLAVTSELSFSQLELLQALNGVQLRKGLGMEEHPPLAVVASPAPVAQLLLHHDVDGHFVCLDLDGAVYCDVEHSTPADWHCRPAPASTHSALH